ncbi:rod-determining factor RdfA [Halobellus marinus]|uniref:rod-determining factor RdfA n=1 Tax=Halobellus TaxID=1073986 RepID=UPI00360B8A03
MASLNRHTAIEEYTINSPGNEFEDRWLGRGYESQSLRSLADWCNKYTSSNISEILVTID